MLQNKRRVGVSHRSPSRNEGRYVMSSSSGTESSTVIQLTRWFRVLGEMT